MEQVRKQQTVKITSNPGIYKAICHNGRYLNNKKTKV